MKGKWLRLLAPMALMLLLTGCLFRPPDDLYKLPDVPADYERLTAAIKNVRSGLELEYATSTDVALIISGDNTATIQLQDLDGDGQRESAVTFLKVPGVEKSLKIYIFTQEGEDYKVTGVVEGDGTAIYSVDYVDLNGSGTKELVVSWQIATGVYQLGAYTLDDLECSAAGTAGKAVSGERSELLATQLLLTSCSGGTDGTSVTSGYRLLDFDQDTRTEIAVARIDSGGLNSMLEVYGWKDGAFISLDSVSLSAGVVSLSRIRSNYLQGELSPPALYVSSTLADGRRVVDVVAYQKVEGQTEKDLVNLSLDDTGVSREILQSYADVGLTDINDDTVMEIPAPTPLPTYGGEGQTINFWLIDWVQYGEAGQRRYVMTTYHNVNDSWYLEIPESWRDKITISRNDQVSGQREVIFSLWRGEEEPQAFLSIYRLTGSNRANAVTRGSRFILREEESVIYAAQFYDIGWDCGLDETDLLNSFKTIQTSWNSE